MNISEKSFLDLFDLYSRPPSEDEAAKKDANSFGAQLALLPLLLPALFSCDGNPSVLEQKDTRFSEDDVDVVVKALSLRECSNLDPRAIRITIAFFLAFPSELRTLAIRAYSSAFEVIIAFEKSDFLKSWESYRQYQSLGFDIEILTRVRVEAAGILASFKCQKLEFLMSDSSFVHDIHRSTPKHRVPELLRVSPRISDIANSLYNLSAILQTKYDNIDDRSLAVNIFVRECIVEVLFESSFLASSGSNSLNHPTKDTKVCLIELCRSESIAISRVFRLFSETEKILRMPFQSQLHREVREAETMRRLLQIDFSNVYTNISEFLRACDALDSLRFSPVLFHFIRWLVAHLKIEITLNTLNGGFSWRVDKETAVSVQAQLLFFPNTFESLLSLPLPNYIRDQVMNAESICSSILDQTQMNKRSAQRSSYGDLLEVLANIRSNENIGGSILLLTQVISAFSPSNPLHAFAHNILGVLYATQKWNHNLMAYIQLPHIVGCFQSFDMRCLGEGEGERLVEYFGHHILDWSPVFNLTIVFEKLGDLESSERFLRLIIQQLKGRPSLGTLRDPVLPPVNPIPLDPNKPLDRHNWIVSHSKSFHFQMRHFGYSDTVALIAIRLRLISVLIRMGRPGQAGVVLAEIYEIVNTTQFLRSHAFDFTLTKLAVQINIAASHFEEALKFLEQNLPPSLKAELRREALDVFLHGHYETALKLWLLEVDLLLQLGKSEEAYKELKGLEEIFTSITSHELKTFSKNGGEDAMDIDEAPVTSEYRLSPKRSKYQAKLFHRFGVVSEVFNRLDEAATNFQMAIHLSPRNELYAYSFVGLVLQLPPDHHLVNEHLSNALYLWHRVRPDLIARLPNPAAADLSAFDDAIKALEDLLYGASRYSKSIMSPSEFQLRTMDFEVMVALRAERAKELETREIESLLRSAPSNPRNGGLSFAPQSHPQRSVTQIVID